MNAAGFPVQNVIVQSFWPLCLDRLERNGTGDRDASPHVVLDRQRSCRARHAGAARLHADRERSFSRRSAGYEYSAPDQDTIDLIGPVVTVAHLLGRKVVVWTVDDVARMQQLAAIGVDGIISDRPDLLVATFGP